MDTHNHNAILTDWHATLNAMDAPVCTVDLDSKIVAANQAMQFLFNKKELDIKGHKITEIFEELRLSVQHYNKHLQVCIHPRTYKIKETPLLNGNGCQIGAVIFFEDISDKILAQEEQRKSEEMASWFISVTNDAIFSVSGEKIMYANAAAMKLFGAKSGQSMFRQNIFSFFRPECHDFIKHHILNIHDHKDTSRNHNHYTLIRLDGSASIVEIVGNLHSVDKTHKKASVFVCLRDITEALKQECEMMEMSKRLERANKLSSIGVLSSSLAHEVNTPNASIMASIHTLRMIISGTINNYISKLEEIGVNNIGKLPMSRVKDVIVSAIERIEEGSTRIDNIITHLKTLAHDGGNASMKTVNTDEMIKKAIDFLAPEIKKHTKYFSVKIDQELPSIMCNVTGIQQVISNVIINAIQALPNPDKALQIRVKNSHDKSAIIITVTDEGAGIAKELLQKINNPRDTMFITTKPSGTGLGLYISKKIIAQHGGKLHVTSKEGSGTRVNIILPIQPQQTCEGLT